MLASESVSYVVSMVTPQPERTRFCLNNQNESASWNLWIDEKHQDASVSKRSYCSQWLQPNCSQIDFKRQIRYFEQAEDIPHTCDICYSKFCTSTLSHHNSISKSSGNLPVFCFHWLIVKPNTLKPSGVLTSSGTVQGASLVFCSIKHPAWLEWAINRMCCISDRVYICCLVPLVQSKWRKKKIHCKFKSNWGSDRFITNSPVQQFGLVICLFFLRFYIPSVYF